MSNNNFTVRFWGVRGTTPTSQQEVLRYGGNTSCVEVECGGHTFILDTGTGAIALGKELTAQRIDILYSHTHIDHINGLPFFTPAYDSTRRIDFWAGNLRPNYDLPQVINHLMTPPIFPVTPRDLKAEIHYHDFTAGDEIRTGHWLDAGIRITTHLLPHPGGATGYRIEYDGHSLCYITDLEHTPGSLNYALIDFVKDASCMIYDTSFSDEQFDQYIGWGHSTWQEAVRIANAANVHSLVASHHDPSSTDDILDSRAKKIKRQHPNAHMAHEGLEIQLNKL